MIILCIKRRMSMSIRNKEKSMVTGNLNWKIEMTIPSTASTYSIIHLVRELSSAMMFWSQMIKNIQLRKSIKPTSTIMRTNLGLPCKISSIQTLLIFDAQATNSRFCAINRTKLKEIGPRLKKAL